MLRLKKVIESEREREKKDKKALWLLVMVLESA